MQNEAPFLKKEGMTTNRCRHSLELFQRKDWRTYILMLSIDPRIAQLFLPTCESKGFTPTLHFGLSLVYLAAIMVAVYGNIFAVFLNDFILAVYADAFNLVAGVFISGYAVNTEAVQTEFFNFRRKFFRHSLHDTVGDGAVGKSPGEDSGKFITGKGAVALELTIWEPFQQTFFCQILNIGIGPVILWNIREEERACFLCFRTLLACQCLQFRRFPMQGAHIFPASAV